MTPLSTARCSEVGSRVQGMKLAAVRHDRPQQNFVYEALLSGSLYIYMYILQVNALTYLKVEGKSSETTIFRVGSVRNQSEFCNKVQHCSLNLDIVQTSVIIK